MTIPDWLQITLWTAGGIAACTVIWKQLLHPLARLISYLQEALPLVRELTAQFKETPDSFSVLEEIAAQFKTDSGSTLRDIINNIQGSIESLKASAEESREAAKELRIKAQILDENLQVVKRLAATDREDAAHRLRLSEQLLTELKGIDATTKSAPSAVSSLAQGIPPPAVVVTLEGKLESK